MGDISFNEIIDGALVDATVIANGYATHGVTTGAGRTVVHFADDVPPATAEAIFSGIGAWTLSNTSAVLDTPLTVTGYDANATYTIHLDGEEIANGSDDSSPYALTFTPTVPGTYVVMVIAVDGTKSGRIEMEVN